ncbi:hypothetical protein AA23498_2725 [Acetobacter nitrogenifigens DSM 23921 = NBRC 105050]|uniref:DNA binding HTH domain-containing protein n=2 Tax=Acetobacter nitrogenifigens TaxID=285268 RepID=A0A511XDU7_9PROT|nr:hypothetical protein AA23498_2725 [Acetobacter nitrogenifigens DSM 23921 = NBRC 105050]GEN61126.1 hypothetical protein ANI02nite_30100 [Acetobacter nitrogenifigens DSM 23921 = NBRC 105050]
MARESCDWISIDPILRHFAICGVSVAMQARRLGVSERSIYQRRIILGISRKQREKRNARKAGHAIAA